MTAQTLHRDALHSRQFEAYPENWRTQAACAGTDPELWHGERSASGRPPNTGENRRVTEAKAICRRCPAKPLCLAWALESGDDWAILGGTTPAERRTIRQTIRPDRPPAQNRCVECSEPCGSGRYCGNNCRNRAYRHRNPDYAQRRRNQRAARKGTAA